MPQPSHLVLLEQLPTQPPGTKVRFLGCVHAYDPVTATLDLKSRFPATSPDNPSASVDVSAIVDGLDHELLQTGAWVNVMGDLDGVAKTSGSSSKSKRKAAGPPPPPKILASMIWSAGVVDAERYADAVRAYQKPLADMG
ncbi:hypothetical protein MBLNU230_g3896t1 [Neophaeotheca triangularis]